LRGSDRTGVFIAVFRVRYQEWTVEQAYDEMSPLVAGVSSFFDGRLKLTQRDVRNHVTHHILIHRPCG
jgi:hypothetical protein